jgi:hypothetical protein
MFAERAAQEDVHELTQLSKSEQTLLWREAMRATRALEVRCYMPHTCRDMPAGMQNIVQVDLRQASAVNASNLPQFPRGHSVKADKAVASAGNQSCQ